MRPEWIQCCLSALKINELLLSSLTYWYLSLILSLSSSLPPFIFFSPPLSLSLHLFLSPSPTSFSLPLPPSHSNIQRRACINLKRRETEEKLQEASVSCLIHIPSGGLCIKSYPKLAELNKIFTLHRYSCILWDIFIDIDWDSHNSWKKDHCYGETGPISECMQCS